MPTTPLSGTSRKVGGPRGRGRPSGGALVVDRQVVLDNAELVIRRDGAAASLEAIARESGVTKPIVYARVGGRTELATALAERLTERLTAAAGAALASSTDGRDAVASLIRATLETMRQERELFLYVTGGNTYDDRLQLAARVAAPFGRLLRRWRGDEGLDPAAGEAWAYGIVGMLNLVALWWINESDRSADDLADQLTELLWSGLSGP